MPISCHFRDCKALLVTYSCKKDYNKYRDLYLFTFLHGHVKVVISCMLVANKFIYNVHWYSDTLLELVLLCVDSCAAVLVPQVLSRAFRNRFVELHFDEIPSSELVEILQKRCQLPQSYSQLLVSTMLQLQVTEMLQSAISVVTAQLWGGDVCYVSLCCRLSAYYTDEVTKRCPQCIY